MPTTNMSGHEIYLLKRWTTRAHELPMLSPLARLALAVPALQTQSEHLILSAGIIKAELAWCGQRRASNDPEELLDDSRVVEEVQSGDTGFN